MYQEEQEQQQPVDELLRVHGYGDPNDDAAAVSDMPLVGQMVSKKFPFNGIMMT